MSAFALGAALTCTLAHLAPTPWTSVPALRKGVIKSYVDVFEAANASKDGVLSASEFKDALRELRVDSSASDEDALLRAFDRDGNGRMDYQEFIKFVVHGRRRLRLVELNSEIRKSASALSLSCSDAVPCSHCVALLQVSPHAPCVTLKMRSACSGQVPTALCHGPTLNVVCDACPGSRWTTVSSWPRMGLPPPPPSLPASYPTGLLPTCRHCAADVQAV